MINTTIKALVARMELIVTPFTGLTPETAYEMDAYLSDYHKMVAEAIAPAGGQIPKFMGNPDVIWFPDEGLPDEEVDAGVLALLKLQADGASFALERHLPWKQSICVHYGTIFLGRAGLSHDLLGPTITTLLSLKSTGFAITPEAWQKLSPETRKLLETHKPPVIQLPKNYVGRTPSTSD